MFSRLYASSTAGWTVDGNGWGRVNGAVTTMVTRTAELKQTAKGLLILVASRPHRSFLLRTTACMRFMAYAYASPNEQDVFLGRRGVGWGPLRLPLAQWQIRDSSLAAADVRRQSSQKGITVP